MASFFMACFPLKRRSAAPTYQERRMANAQTRQAECRTPCVSARWSVFAFAKLRCLTIRYLTTAALQKALRIDIPLQPQVALRFRRRAEPVAQIGREIEAARRLHQQPEAVAAAHDRERRLGWPQHAHRLVVRRGAREAARKSLGAGPRPGRDHQAGEPAERRIAGAFARRDLGPIEGLAVSPDQALHDRMVGLVGLQEPVAAASLASGPPRHLMQELERALGRARVAVAHAEVGVDDADQVELGEMMALGDKLRADDEIDAAFRDLVELLAHALAGRDQVARQHQDAGLREEGGRLLLDALDPRPAGREAVGRLAFGTGGGLRRPEAAMTAHRLAAKPVIDQPGVAMGTGQAEPPGAGRSPPPGA